jgi:hypothetical protein
MAAGEVGLLEQVADRGEKAWVLVHGVVEIPIEQEHRVPLANRLVRFQPFICPSIK